ncbi:hypothetical protein POM88_006297 [Heracleum sosnowskyi]|uniref:Ubiquitin-like protease family profile domain-containing protein n=1 Tax=Heracleum sosnowskyi TaxID=360622 RepID=A0AAD8J419_9APIA|nr:hypothetical protein POM88_006297 [Heracleum sosnowskyi]
MHVELDSITNQCAADLNEPSVNVERSSRCGGLFGALGRGVNMLDDLDVRTEKRSCKVIQNADLSDNSDDFVTPREMFGESTPYVEGKCSIEEQDCKLGREIAVNAYNGDTNEVIVQRSFRQVCAENKKEKTQNKRNLALKKGTTLVERGLKIDSPRSKIKKKAARTYHRYIQKKFSPSIMTDVIVNLSVPQIQWVTSTGFGGLLYFRMLSYTHKLGYNVVEAFNGPACSLKVKAGTITITESIVHSVMGLPIGNEAVVCNEDKEAYSVWAKQFPGCKSSEITPLKVRDKILENPNADMYFKWNFLIMMYNFFIESNQNRFLVRDVLRFSGDIEDCKKYNWCGLMIEKLKETHSYWAKDTKRNFAGPLPFLIYLYVSKVKKKGITFVATSYPTYRGWSDMLLRERQKYDLKKECFGEGELVKFDNVKADQYLEDTRAGQDCADGTEMTLLDIVVRDEIHNKEEDCVNSRYMVTNDKLNDDDACEFLILDIVHNGDQQNKGEVVVDVMAMDYEAQVSDIGVHGVTNTQACVDEEIEHHFEEDLYMLRFEKNLIDLKEVYDKCLNNCEVAFALYPENGKLAELNEKYSYFFKMFRDSIPMSKVLCVGKVDDNDMPKLGEAVEEEFIPNFSLGLSQMTPKNLCAELDGISNSPLIGQFGRTGYSGKGKEMVEEGFNVMGERHEVEKKENYFVEIMRPRRGIKASQFCRSPYVSRVVDVSTHQITTEESNIWELLFQSKNDINEHLFEWNNRMCTRGHFQSMQENNMMESTVIDTWSYLLNENELLRDDCSPLRLFMTSETTYGPLRMEVGEGGTHDKMERNAAFHDNMDIVVQMVCDMHNKNYEVKDFEMFVFPIYSSAHHYIISYNMKKPQLHIIDNIFHTGGVEENYGDLPAILHECFCDWISIYNLPKEREIINLEPKIVRMAWQTLTNSVDCGVFVMRHMETYMGKLYKWKVGLRPEKDNQKPLLNKLRIIYCHRILTWAKNCKRAGILEGAVKLGKGK